MKVRSRIVAEVIIESHHQERLVAMTDRWQDEASEAALNGNPQRAHYLEHMIQQVARIDTEIRDRQEKRRGR